MRQLLGITPLDNQEIRPCKHDGCFDVVDSRFVIDNKSTHNWVEIWLLKAASLALEKLNTIFLQRYLFIYNKPVNVDYKEVVSIPEKFHLTLVK